MRTSTLKAITCLLVGMSGFIAVGFGQQPSHPEARIDLVKNLGLTGQGVVVAIIDRGIDYRHPDFVDENGNTRIAYIFDMLDSAGVNDPDNIYGVGTIHSEAEINAALQSGGAPLTMDRYGHGTATTGIAAGDGSGTAGGEFQGVAPNAKIIAVKITHDAFPAFGSEPGQAAFWDPSYVPIALQFVSDKIDELGMRGVALMNFGSIGGPTDGTSTNCQAMEDFVAAGHVLVCGTGDDGGSDNHAGGSISQGQTVEILVEKGTTSTLDMDFWYSEDDRFEVAIERPNGSMVGPFPSPSHAGDWDDRFLGDISIWHRGANLDFWGATSHRRELYVRLTGAPGVYKMKLTGGTVVDGGFHATLNPATFSPNRFLSHIQSGYSLNDFTSAPNCISPGDYVVQNDWFDINGFFRDITGQGEAGELWLYSSEGLTHDGRLGIDFVAPGEVIFAAYSPGTYYANFSHNMVQGGNGLYGVQNAVSAAAPLSTGVIALMLEANPNLSAQQIKTALNQTARQDSFTGVVPNPTWGNGKLDALAAVQAVMPQTVSGNSVVVTKGDHIAGTIADLAESDNSDLGIRRSQSQIQAVLEFELEGVSFTSNPSAIAFTLEGSVFARTRVDQIIELYDFTLGTFEQVDLRQARRFSDLVTEISPPGDVSRFVEPSTNAVRARVKFRSLNPRQQFAANIDQAVWTITP